MANSEHTIDFSALCAQLSKEARALLCQSYAGIEKEGLRVDANAKISTKPHPAALGSALCHSQITTDYSEAMLELITAPQQNRGQLLGELADIHRFTYSAIAEELIWPGSMPAVLDGELSIPIANYGSSNSGTMKHVYRHGLWHRYGRTMQAITGIHYNYSLPDSLWQNLYAQAGAACSLQDFKSAGYLALIRNFRRYAWIFSYLFGASPALDSSFFKGRSHQLQDLATATLYSEYATCLRMTDIGYKSTAQSSIQVCYNSLSSYINSLGSAIYINYPQYAAMGTERDGQYLQLNCNLLQIENEFYSEIRPKRTPKAGQTPLAALKQHGIEYIEVRIFDLDPFLPLGINERALNFIDALLLHCLLTPSAPCTPAENQNMQRNFSACASSGRDPKLKLQIGANTQSLRTHANELITAMRRSLHDLAEATKLLEAIDYFAGKIADSSKTPSAQIIDSIQEQNLSYSQLMLKQARQHKLLLARPLSPARLEQFKQAAQQSLQRQAELEQSDTLSFAQYLQQYYDNVRNNLT